MNIVDWAVETIDAFGGPGVAFLIALESIFPPIPSEVILPLAGVTAARGEHNLIVMYLWAAAGSMVGAYVLYGIGRALGAERLRRLVIRLPLVHVEDYDKSVRFMDRYGYAGVFFGRMVPGIRSLVSIPAGVYEMNLVRFSLLTLAGSGIWNAIFVGLGYGLGENWHVIEPYTDVISNVVYVIIVVIALWWGIRLLLRERRRRRLGLPDPDAEELRALDAEKD
ncbi:DedA family protein [Brachybacterium sp. AOP25-B2-12]|uniref:DedA family protein n=1 Tax=Brachybacterium sp. AOP25-B2-12 TaxID=3457710 RepID=UPI0040334D61